MFDIELPEFFKNDAISDFFTDNLNEFIEMKTSEFFNSEALSDFVEAAEELENTIISFVNLQRQKVELFNNIKSKYEENNDLLRDLNSQVAAFKISDMGFGFSKDDEDKNDIKNELANRLA